MNGVEVDLSQRHLVASYGNFYSSKPFSVTIYIYIPIFMAIGWTVSKSTDHKKYTDFHFYIIENSDV